MALVLIIIGLCAVGAYSGAMRDRRADEIRRHEDELFVQAYGYDALLARRREVAVAVRKLRAKRGVAVVVGIAVLAVAFTVIGAITDRHAYTPPAAPASIDKPLVALSPNLPPEWTTKATVELRCMDLRATGGNKALDIDIMPGGMLAVRTPLEIGALGAVLLLPAGAYPAREEGRGYIRADITTYPANEVGGGHYQEDFHLTLQKKDGWISIGSNDREFSSHCKPRPLPVVPAQPTPQAPAAKEPAAPNQPAMAAGADGLPVDFICVLSRPNKVRACGHPTPIPSYLFDLPTNAACISESPGVAPTCGSRIAR
jgi:hypothetical protein